MTTKHDDAATDLLIKEVDEELRQEQLQTLWKRHGNAIVGGAVALVLGVAGWQGWTAWQADQRRESSANYAAATKMAEEGKAQDAATALAAIAANGTSGYQLLARFEQADLRLKAGDRDGAMALYDAVANDGGVDQPYRDMARLKAAYLRLESDAAAAAGAAATLADDASPWRHSAREIMGLAALKQGDAQKAGELFRKLSEDAAAPQGVRARAAELLSVVEQKTKG